MRSRRRSVLVAENNRVVAQSLRGHLEHAGFSVLIARDGEQACVLAARQRFDLIVTNLELPVMDGAEFCRHVREDLQLTDVPIAVCARKELEGEAANLVIDYGISQVFYKPIDHDSIVTFARETVSGAMATA